MDIIALDYENLNRQAESGLPGKICSKCRIWKELTEYPANKDARNGKHSWCQSCHNTKNRKGGTGYTHQRMHHWKRKGILNEKGEPFTAADFDRLNTGQCHLCNCPGNTIDRDWAVDHDHNTGIVRGLLCHHCNTGNNWDTFPNWLNLAKAYLERHYGRD